MFDFSDPLWIVTGVVAAALFAVCLVSSVGLASPATSRAEKMQRMADWDDTRGEMPQEPPRVLSPWWPGVGVGLGLILLALSLSGTVRDRENQSRWVLSALAGLVGTVWAISLASAALRMAERIQRLYP